MGSVGLVADIAQHLVAVRAMLRERSLEGDKQALGFARGQAAAPHPRDQLFLPSHMPFALRDMVVDHAEIGRGKGHTRL